MLSFNDDIPFWVLLGEKEKKMRDESKLKLHTLNNIDDNRKKVGELFPEVITESMNRNGELVHAIDFEKLKQLLSDSLVDERERYDFTWVGKNKAILEAGTPIDKTLRPQKDKSVDWDNTENVYIEGDNLEVLKLLQESYLNKIDVIYIDPPYNTGNDFIYNDDFKMTQEEYSEVIGEFDEYNQRMKPSKKDNARFHSDWLNMMYSRLKLARNLLSDDGVIFISIDDNEQAHLKELCNEIFGEENFIATICRNTNSTKNQSLYVSVTHEYCLIYSKNSISLAYKYKETKWSVEKNNIKAYEKKISYLQNEGLTSEEITEELKELTKYPRFIDFTNYWYIDEKGVYRKGDLGGVKNGNMTPILNPLTGKNDPIPPGGYRYDSQKLEKLIQENRIHFHTDGSLPTIKRYLNENRKQRPKSIMSDDQRPDYNLLKKMGLMFDNPKQLSFMKRIISIFSKDSIILDFFSGSGTTADAVMQLNAEDGGNRKFIMVQLPEKIDEKQEAYKEGYRYITEIGEERIRRAGAKVKEEHPEVDTGFRVFKVDSSNMKDIEKKPNEVKQEELFEVARNIKEDRNDLDLLYQVMLDWGLELSLPYESELIEETIVHNVCDGALIACFADNLNETLIRKIAEKEPFRVVFKDVSFENSATKTNVIEMFKEISPETKVKVI